MKNGLLRERAKRRIKRHYKVSNTRAKSSILALPFREATT